jgi:hypothetical protein
VTLGSPGGRRSKCFPYIKILFCSKNFHHDYSVAWSFDMQFIFTACSLNPCLCLSFRRCCVFTLIAIFGQQHEQTGLGKHILLPPTIHNRWDTNTNRDGYGTIWRGHGWKTEKSAFDSWQRQKLLFSPSGTDRPQNPLSRLSKVYWGSLP